MAAALRPSPQHQAYLEAIAALLEAGETPTATAIRKRLGVTKQAAHEALSAMVERGELRYSPPRQASYKLPKVKPETDWAAIAQRNAERFAPGSVAASVAARIDAVTQQQHEALAAMFAGPHPLDQNGMSSSSTSGEDEG